MNNLFLLSFCYKFYFELSPLSHRRWSPWSRDKSFSNLNDLKLLCDLLQRDYETCYTLLIPSKQKRNHKNSWDHIDIECCTRRLWWCMLPAVGKRHTGIHLIRCARCNASLMLPCLLFHREASFHPPSPARAPCKRISRNPTSSWINLPFIFHSQVGRIGGVGFDCSKHCYPPKTNPEPLLNHSTGYCGLRF